MSSALQERMNALLGQVNTTVEQSEQQSSGGDYFKLAVDSEGNGSAVIRFLPQPDLSKNPFVDKFTHWFKDEVTDKVYSEISATTFKEKDLIGQFNSWLWKKGYEDRSKSQKRSHSWYANVLVIKHDKKPEDVGKVMTYRFGVKIFDKIKSTLAGDESIGELNANPFDVLNGVNFTLKAKKVSGFPNYDDSFFQQSKAPIADTEEEIMKILELGKDLDYLVDRAQLKSEDEQLKILNGVFGRDPLWVEFKTNAGLVDVVQEAPEVKQAPETTSETTSESKAAPKPEPSSSSDSVDDILASL